MRLGSRGVVAAATGACCVYAAPPRSTPPSRLCAMQSRQRPPAAVSSSRSSSSSGRQRAGRSCSPSSLHPSWQLTLQTWLMSCPGLRLLGLTGRTSTCLMVRDSQEAAAAASWLLKLQGCLSLSQRPQLTPCCCDFSQTMDSHQALLALLQVPLPPTSPSGPLWWLHCASTAAYSWTATWRCR